jgi:cysteine dioxygenase
MINPAVIQAMFAPLDRFEGVVPRPAIVDWLRRTPVTLESIRDLLVFSDDQYVRNLLFTAATYQGLILCWRSGQSSPIHNHHRSNCGVRVLRGVATETNFVRAADGTIVATGSHQVPEGHICFSANADIHQMANLQPDGADLVTLHLYSPPLLQMDVYSPEFSSAGSWKAPVNESFAVGVET